MLITVTDFRGKQPPFDFKSAGMPETWQTPASVMAMKAKQRRR